ncbi:hypothetical protein M2102_001164 [Fusobacterium sp. PH5-7]|uniref:autotransporter domain-containing protein n=1 Tax=Fusobacterium sp. PH5-7 TaxID=2940528 RepID=UPI002474C905|nr:autotransporter domain-containing protein [Fusobacterium sp. PH5-7]MDH6457536.1 hypothetical protein [Fusobacterium sp. PH5-7]
MIEKIMRAVKSSNKKRGRNITIGAVVGMLLSCSAVMGADVAGLEITKDTSGEIKFSKNGTEFTPENPNNPYPENTWDKESITYTNNSGISVNSDSGNAYGLKLNGDLSGVSFINNGSVSATGSSKGYGIYNDSRIIGSIKNNGTISGSYSGIYNKDGSIKTITNSGSIYNKYRGIYNDSTNSGTSNIERITNSGSVYGKNGDGISNVSNNSGTSNIERITNSGSIYGIDHGIFNDGNNSGTSSIRSIVNSGNIYGKQYGIYNRGFKSDRVSIGSISNNGVIYGAATILNYEGTISNVYNYGLLVSNGSKVIHGTVDFAENKYGLVFIVDGEKYTLDKDYSGEFGAISPDERVIIDYGKKGDKELDFANPKTKIYTIVNAKANEASDSVTGTENLVLKNGMLFHEDSDTSGIKDYSSDKNYILNGITDTLLAKGKNNKVNNSIINAYKTAVVMKGESSLILENTVINGGIDGEYDSTIEEYINYSPAISVIGNNNFLTIKGDSIVNGDMKATGDKNTLNLYGKQNITRSSDGESMNILHDIEGFGRIQIENEVTFFEDVKVTGVDRININNGGTLSLRLKKDGAKATHALSAENTGLLIAGKEEGGSETAGTLNFITNGMGTGTVIDMGGIELENVYLRANSILYDLEVVEKTESDASKGDIRLDVGTSLADIFNERAITPDPYRTKSDEVLYNSLNKIYQSSVADDDNVDAVTGMIGSSSDEEQWRKLLSFLGGIYTESPYSYSSELSRRSLGMFRDIITENEFRPNLNNWLIMGGLTHADGGTKDTYYGKNYYKIDSGSSTTNADMKLTGAYMLAKYGYSENLSLGLTLGGNKSEAEMSMSKVKGNSGYLGAFAENYRGNLTLKAGAGVQYSEYDTDRSTLGGHSYSDKYSDMTYDIYLNGRYSHQVGDNLFLEPYATLSYTYVDQDGADEGSKALAIETDSKSFDYTVAKVGVDLKKVIPHEKGKSTLTAGVSYTKILDGAEEEYITGRFKGGSNFDILVAHKNEHSIGLNAKYALELENGVLIDIKGTYSVERDSHNGSGKNKAKGEWIAGAGMGYKF